MNAQEMKGNEQSGNVGVLAGGASDKGPTRSENQDAFWIPDIGIESSMGALFLVADGVGGQESGADAANLAVQTAKQLYYDKRAQGSTIRDALNEALLQANQAVYDEAQRRQVRRMGSTFVAAVIDQGQLTIAHVGDARAYLIRKGEMRQLTRDDTWVQKQVEAGLLTEEQAAKHEYRNIVTQVLGNKPEVNVHLSKTHELQQDDLVLLCSDGLYDVLSEDEILAIIVESFPPTAAQQLIAAAISAEASDNITAVVVKPEVTASIAEETMIPLAAVDQQSTMPTTVTDQPTILPAKPEVSAPPSAVEKNKASKWLIIFAIAAVILIIGAVLLFWLRNRDLDATVESAADTNMTATAVVDNMTPESVGALRPLLAATAEEPTPTILDELQNVNVTEAPPPPTPTLRPMPSLAATPELRGCANDRIIAFVWSQEQLDNGSCTSTPNLLEVGAEVLIMEEVAVSGSGECGGIQFIKIQSLARPDLEGWVNQDAIDSLDPGSSCSS